MNLYLLTQNENSNHDTYDDCVVAAENEDEARCIHPDGSQERILPDGSQENWYNSPSTYRDWAYYPRNVKVKLIGEAVEGIKKGVICASFHAG